MNESTEGKIENKLKEVPDVMGETGVSSDFRNEYAFMMSMFDTHGEEVGMQEIRRMIMKFGNRKMKKYEERFSSLMYASVVNDQNRETVRKIDELVDAFNTKLDELGEFTGEHCMKLCLELEELILGKRSL